MNINCIDKKINSTTHQNSSYYRQTSENTNKMDMFVHGINSVFAVSSLNLLKSKVLYWIAPLHWNFIVVENTLMFENQT